MADERSDTPAEPSASGSPKRTFTRRIALLLVWSSLATCRTNPPTPAAPAQSYVSVTMEPLLSESYSGVEAPLRQIIREGAAWTDFWSRVYANRSPKPEPPAIDFKREMLVVAAMGQRGTGGYTISIQRIYRVEKGLVVVVKETSPAAGCMLTHAFTAPVTAVRVPRLDVPMTYIETKETEHCG